MLCYNESNYATELNVNFIKRLRGENNENMVYVCGEAKTHCVKTSAEDLVGSFTVYGLSAVP